MMLFGMKRSLHSILFLAEHWDLKCSEEMNSLYILSKNWFWSWKCVMTKGSNLVIKGRGIKLDVLPVDDQCHMRNVTCFIQHGLTATRQN